MSAEPIVIYAHRVDPAGVLRLLREMVPDLEVEGSAAAWTRATLRGPARLLRTRTTLSFRHDPSYYTSADWPRQMRGMQGYFARFPEHPNRGRVMLLIASFRFALSLFPVPDPDLYLDSDDPRLRHVFAVASSLEGALFLPSGLYDAQGRLLYGGDEPDPDAVMPGIYREVPPVPRKQRRRSEGGLLPDADDAPPPTPTRVAQRALALAAVTGRALLEQDPPGDSEAAQTLRDLRAWVDAVGVERELEDPERDFLRQPHGAPARQDTIDFTWRLEGLAVLAWALQRFELPPHDRLVVPQDLLRSLGILDAEAAGALLASPALRSREELDALRERLFAVNWRLTDWRQKPRALDFASFAQRATFGLDLTGVPLREDDLAVGGAALSAAPPEAIDDASSAAVERHRAANWLGGGREVYSETDVST